MPTFREDVRLGTKVPQLKTEDYNDKSVTAEKIADGAIEGKKIALNSVETKHIADSAVTRKKIAIDAVGMNQIGSGEVTTAHLRDGCVTTDKIAGGAVDSEHITDAAIEERHISSKSVTNIKLADKAVDTRNIANLSVISDHISSNAILERHLASNVVTVEKMADEVWNKLKAEYLRLDGNNAMSGTLDMDDNAIINPEKISATKLRTGGSQVFSLNLLGEEGITLSISSISSGRHSSQECVMSSDGTWEAKGFYTTERSNLGLLNNNAEVVLAMSDSDVDACFQTVFV